MVLCAAIGLSACGSSESESVFTGETADLPEWQANLDLISPSVYGTTDDLELEAGTYISVIGKRGDSAYWKQIKAGVQQAADDINEKLGYSGSDKVKVLFNAPSDAENIDEQVNILDEEMARYPDVIAIASIDEDASAVQFDLASIPIVAFDSGNSYQGIQCTCMTDNKAAAGTGAAKLGEAIGGSGEVALIVQDSVSGNAKERVEGFQAEIQANYPDVSVVEIVYMDKLDEMKRKAAAEQLGITEEQLAELTAAAAGENVQSETAEESADSASMTDEAKKQTEEISALAESMSDAEAVAYYFEKHPDLKGCFAANADAVLLGSEAINLVEKHAEENSSASDSEKTAEDAESEEQIDEQSDEQTEASETKENSGIVLMGFDAGKEQLEALRSGEVSGLVVQNPFGMGYAAVVAAARTVLEIGNEAQVDTGYVWVDQSNIEDESIQFLLYE